LTPPSRVALHGWLAQGDADPFAGYPAVDAVLATALGLDKLTATPAALFDPATLRPSRLSDTALAELAACVEPGGVDISPVCRASASVGQGYFDVLARRAGDIPAPVDAVVAPASHAAACAVLTWCARTGTKAHVVGGATGVVGAFEAPDDPVRIAVSTARLSQVIAISTKDHTAVVEAGVRLEGLDAALAREGMTLGHEPQSYHGVTLGGAIAAHGAGQRSNGYGRMADLVISARLATPIGSWATEPYREAATGPWLGGLITGSEGALGLITDATVRVTARPPVSAEIGFLFADFAAATEVARTLVQDGVGLSMIRVSDPVETTTLGRFARARRAPKASDWWIDQWLKLRGVPSAPCLLLIGVDTDAQSARATFAGARRAAKGSIGLGARAGQSWRRGRFEAPYWREGLLNRGLGVETLETIVPWSRLIETHRAITAALTHALAETLQAGRPLVMCHLSHAYTEAASLYFTVVFPRDPADPHAQWARVKASANAALAAAGAAPSHHHGLGADHAALLSRAKDPVSRELLNALKHTLDPTGVLLAPGLAQTEPSSTSHAATPHG
jgi:alkyldihydroxyacetonephosphate synthase